MELIIKPTGRCNFNCTFCSANLLKIKHDNNVSNDLKQIITNLQPDSLIITGGDPLMMSKEYYEQLLSLGNYPISFTTNLKGFYNNPDYWTPLFKNERIGICTSFQYGDERLWDLKTPYTEEMFKKVMHLFYDRIGYMPSFIAIIDENNADKALDHLYLAKELGTKCKLNPLLALGKSKTFYPKYKMVDIWLKIYEKNLQDYLDSDIQFYQGGCGFNTNLLCQSSIRAIYIDGNNKIHYSNCEDCLSNGEEIDIDASKPLCIPERLNPTDMINDKCLYCELCNFCNGCRNARKTAKITPNYCDEMLKRKQRILSMGWKL